MSSRCLLGGLASFSFALALFAAGPTAGAADAPLPAGERVTWAEEKVEALTPLRGRVLLNGLWRFQPANEDAPGADWGWARVPGSWHNLREWPRWNIDGVVARGESWRALDLSTVGRAWYERELAIPADWAEREIVLRLTRLSTDAEVFLDGKKQGGVAWPEGEVSLKDAKPGRTHSLRVRVTAAASGQLVGHAMDFNDVQLQAAKLRTRGLVDDVWLESRPTGPRIAGAFLRPSVRERALFVDLELAGPPPKGRHELRAVAKRWPDGAEVKSWTLELPEGTGENVSGLRLDWERPELWELGAPRLHTLELTLTRPKAKRPLDVWSERFGFREFWIEGRDFYLNGSKTRLRPFNALKEYDISGVGEAIEAHLRSWLDMNFNLIELWPYAQNRGTARFEGLWAKKADELGMGLMLPFSNANDYVNNLWGLSGPAPAEQRAAFAEAVRRDWKRWRNHPSILVWVSTGNTFSHGDDQNPKRIGQRAALEANGGYGASARVKVGRELLGEMKKLDPTRPVTSHHNGAVGDFQTMNHYLNLLPLQEREEHLSQWAEKGDMPYMSVEFGVPFALTMVRGRRGYGGSISTEPLVTEHAAGVLGPRAYELEPESYRAQIASRFRSDQTYDNVDNWETIHGHPAFQELAALFNRHTWRSWRTWGLSGGLIPWGEGYSWRVTDDSTVPLPPFAAGREGIYLPRMRAALLEAWSPARGRLTPAGAALREGNSPLLAWLGGPRERFTEKDHDFFAGAPIEKSAILLNDTRGPRGYALEWTAGFDGAQPVRGRAEGRLAPGETVFEPIRFSAPAVLAAPTDGELRLSVRWEGKAEPAIDTFALRAHPRDAEPAPTVHAWDPAGETSAWLRSLGVEVRPLAAGAGLPPKNEVLVVGRRAYGRGPLPPGLAEWVAEGGRLVTFAQEPEALRAAGWRVHRYVSRQVWPVATQRAHPILDGLDERDLRDWRGAGTLVPPIEAPEPGDGVMHDKPRWPYRWGNRGSVASGLLEKPHRSAWTPILEGEFDLAYSPLLELRHGRGLALQTQLDLEDRPEEPMAALLTRRVLRHAAQWRAPEERADGVVYMGGERGGELLRGLGLEFADNASIGPETGLVIVGPEQPVRDASLRGFVERGGRVLFLARLPGALPFGTSGAEGAWHGVAPGELPDWPEARGLSVSDLRVRVETQVPLLKGGPATEVAGGGVLGRFRVGAGSVVFFQLPPDALPAETKTYYRYSQWRLTRALAQVIANLGGRFSLDAASLAPDLRPDPLAPRPLVGEWRWKVEQRVPTAATPAEAAPEPVNEGRRQDWQAKEFDDSGWSRAQAPVALESLAPDMKDFDGVVWFRTEIDLPEEWSGRAAVLELGVLDDFDVAYVNGTQVGATATPDAWSKARSYALPGWVLKPGRNVIALRIYDRFGGGGLMAKRAEDIRLRVAKAPERSSFYAPGFREDYELGDDPARYYRW